MSLSRICGMCCLAAASLSIAACGKDEPKPAPTETVVPISNEVVYQNEADAKCNGEKAINRGDGTFVCP